MMRRALALVIAWQATAEAGDAHVTAATQTAVYIDVGTADGLTATSAWSATVNGRALAIRVAAIATHTAILELDPTLVPVGATIALPPGLNPPIPITPPPPPPAAPIWRDDPGALAIVERDASRTQPAAPGTKDDTTITGELSLSAFLAADTSNSSTSTHEVALASQLSVASGAWQYDHLLEVRAAGAPEIFTSPLQHARAQLDIYELRLAYHPEAARYAAALGRQTGSPLGELGSIDGARGHYAIGRQFELTAFAGLRPASDLALSLVPRAGADVGWHVATVGGTRVRADAGMAVDDYKGAIDRALAAAAVSVLTPMLVIHGDVALDLASDAAGRGPGLTRAAGMVRAKRDRLVASLSGGYDRPFYDRALVAEVPDLVLGPRTFFDTEARYALRDRLDVGGNARVAWGNGFTSTYADAFASWYSSARDWRLTAGPHAVAGSLVDQVGGRASFDIPIGTSQLDLGASFDRVWAGGARAWAEMGRIAWSRSFLHRWRTSLSTEVAAGDGPTRVLLFALLGYRFGR